MLQTYNITLDDRQGGTSTQDISVLITGTNDKPFISILAVRIMVGSFHTLTDAAMIPGHKLSKVVMDVPGVQHCREIRTRGGPGAVYVDMIVHVDGQMSLRAAHDVADRIEEAVMSNHPEIVDVVVHLEPAERRR